MNVTYVMLVNLAESKSGIKAITPVTKKNHWAVPIKHEWGFWNAPIEFLIVLNGLVERKPQSRGAAKE